jgi:hypothetical protein
MEPKNDKLIASTQLEELPPIVLAHLSKDQKQYLQFERRKFKVIGTPQIKTYHIGSLGKGSTAGGGLGTALGDSWGIFGNMSSTKMATLNQFKTDIQLRLEDETTHEKIFFEKSFPIEMTLSIEPGDSFSIFSVKTEKENLPGWEGKEFLSFTPFIAQVDETKQLLPLGKVPQVTIPEQEIEEEPFPWRGFLIGAIVFITIAILVILMAESTHSNNPNNSLLLSSPNIENSTAQ